ASNMNCHLYHVRGVPRRSGDVPIQTNLLLLISSKRCITEAHGTRDACGCPSSRSSAKHIEVCVSQRPRPACRLAPGHLPGNAGCIGPLRNLGSSASVRSRPTASRRRPSAGSAAHRRALLVSLNRALHLGHEPDREAQDGCLRPASATARLLQVYRGLRVLGLPPTEPTFAGFALAQRLLLRK